MKRIGSVILILFLVSVPGLAVNGDLNGIYERTKDDKYEIKVFLPTSHYTIKVLETNRTIENPTLTNILNFTVDQNDLEILKNSFTISGDSTKEYQVILKKIETNSNQVLKILEFLLSFLLGGIFLFVLYKLLTKKFKEYNNTR